MVRHSAWTNGTVKHINVEVVRTGHAILSEAGRLVNQWVQIVSTIQWALNTTFRERYGSTPFEVFIGRKPRTDFYSALFNDEDDKMVMDKFHPE